MRPGHLVMAVLVAASLQFTAIPGLIGTTQAADVFTQCRKARSMNVRIRACTHIIKFHGSRQNRFLAHHDRGIAWWNKGNLKRALADFNAALRYRPNDADTRRHRADVLAEMRLHRKERRQTRTNASQGRKKNARAAGKSLPRYERLIRQARNLFDRNRNKPAMKKLRQALALLEKKERKTALSVRERLLKAEALVLLDRPDPAMDIWRSLQGRLPSDRAMRDQLIDLWHRLDNMGENAAKLLVGRLTEEASPIKADYHAIHHHMLGTEAMGKTEEMRGTAQRLIDLWQSGRKAPRGEDAAFYASRAGIVLGNVFLNEDNLKSAEQAYRLAARAKPDYHVAWNNLGWIALLNGQNEQAIELFEKAIKLSPRYKIAHGNLHTAWSNLGLHRRAVRVLSRLVSLDPSAEHYRMRAWHALLAGDLEQARRDIRRALSKAPKDANASGVLGLLQIRLGKTNKALANIEKAVRKGADWPLLHYEHGRLLERTGRLAQARKAYERAIAAEKPKAGEEPENRKARETARERLSKIAANDATQGVDNSNRQSRQSSATPEEHSP